MADFGSPIFEKFPKINDKTFFHSFNGFVFKKYQTLILKKLKRQKSKMAAKNQNGVKWSVFIKSAVGTTSIRQIINYFWMQFVEWRNKE
jgi:hypothetical protein